MSQLIESIKILNGRVYNIHYHNKRCNNARKILFGCTDELNIRNQIIVPIHQSRGLYKCRISYTTKIDSIEIIPYDLKPITKLKLVYDNHISYNYKYAARENLDLLFQKRGQADDILIIKNGLLTDTYYGNVILQKNNQFFSPKKPLLEGCYRQRLIEKGDLLLRDIRAESISSYDRLYIVNSMIRLGQIGLSPSEVIA